MKKVLLLLVLPALLITASCSKAILEGDGCITVFKRALNPIGADSYAKVTALFQTNNISASGLSFYRATFNDTIPLNGEVNVYQHFVALQYFNNLPVLNGDIGYHFKNGVFKLAIGTKYNGVGLDAKANLSTQQLRKLFLAEVAKDGFYANRSVKDSCLKAEFGYYNLDLSSTATIPEFVKVWKVTPSGTEYPVAYIRDDTNTVLSYFNGIETVIN